MRRILLAAALAAAAATGAWGQCAKGHMKRAAAGDDEAALTQLVREWADAVVHGDIGKLDQIEGGNFRGTSEGKSFDKRLLHESLRSGAMKVASWTIDDVKVSIRGSAATVSGRSKLTNATYMGKDFSGEYEWTDHFVKQKDGSWRAVSSQSRKLK
jgi:ketosteroid isomerase-like protein